MRAYCEFVDKYKEDTYIMGIVNAKITDPKFRSYYNLLGTEGCRANSFQESIIKSILMDNVNKDVLSIEIYNTFKPGTRMLKKDIKQMLGDIYNRINISTSPKAIDLGKWFDIKEIKILDNSNKWSNGFELLAIKKN